MGRKKLLAGVLAVSCALTVCGCNSTQKTDSSEVLVTEDVRGAYEFTTVVRDTVQKTKIIAANYQQVKEENLSFGTSGGRLAGVYVELGDEVKKGDLLAELYCEDEKLYFTELEYTMKTQRMQIEHLKEQRKLELTQLAAKKSSYTTDEYQSKLKELEDTYRTQIEDLEDKIYIENMEYTQLKRMLEAYRIVAGMDGTVTFIGNTGSEFSAWPGNKMFTISDSEELAFLCSEKDYIPYFTLGETYVFATSTGVEYKTVLEDIDEVAGTMRFELVGGQGSTSLGQRVLYTLVLEERENVLSLPKNAVHTIGDKTYVYYFDENGVRQIKEIEVGLVAGSKVEVVSGLSEGDEVILR